MDELSHLPPAQPQRPYGESKSLAIALVVSAVFLLAAGAISFYLLTKPAGAPTAQQPTGDGSENVKNVGWVTPATIPAAYARRDQNTLAVATTYYTDAAAGCGITTTVQTIPASGTIKEGVLASAKAAQSYGIATTNATDAAEIDMQNQDGKTFTFKTMQLEQTVAVTGVPYTAQRTLLAYKQFGQQVATIAYTCRTEAWEPKNTELKTLVTAFKVKTE
jgi:hypothetical protein